MPKLTKFKKVGLTVGKFAPLHKGHQYLIETALAEVDHFIVLIYDCPEIINISLSVRARWIKKIYPKVEVIEAWGGPMEVGNTDEIKRGHEKYIIRKLRGRKITHFYSSEFYGEHMSLALNAIDRRVDEDRKRIPISATRIRKDPFRYRNYLAPEVYKDFVKNVVFLGAPSTGKTTLVQRLAKELKTIWMPEYGREYWDKHQVNRRLTLKQLVEIAKGHLEREDKLLPKANRYLFTDTNAITTYIFSLYYHGKADRRLVKLAQKAGERYDLVFLCDTDIPYDDTWDRSGEVNRRDMQRAIIKELKSRRVSYVVLRGSLADRVAKVKKTLRTIEK